MIDASNITDFNLTDNELEARILFWITAAGKNGTTAARLITELLTKLDAFERGPFNVLKTLAHEELAYLLKDTGIGCYNQKARTMLELANANLNLRTCTPDDLEKIYGIGMKTSRCFILHSRRDANCAGLDTHMLKHLRKVGIVGVPKSTPTNKKIYLRLEKEVLFLAKSVGETPAEYDLYIWNKYAVK